MVIKVLIDAQYRTVINIPFMYYNLKKDLHCLRYKLCKLFLYLNAKIYVKIILLKSPIFLLTFL